MALYTTLYVSRRPEAKVTALHMPDALVMIANVSVSIPDTACSGSVDSAERVPKRDFRFFGTAVINSASLRLLY